MRRLTFRQLTWLYIVTGILALICVLVYLWVAQNDEDYSYLQLESNKFNLKVFAKPAYESFVETELDSTSFDEIVDSIKRKEILLIQGWGQQINQNHFFVRGYRYFEKPFLSSLLSKFKFWYVIFEIEYESKRVYIKYDWFDGDSQVPVIIQNQSPRPNESAKFKGREINSQISNLISNLKKSN